MRVLELEKEIAESITKLVSKYKSLCICIRFNEKEYLYECIVYNSGVKFIIGKSDLLIIAITKAVYPILGYIEKGRIKASPLLTSIQIKQISEMMTCLISNEKEYNIFICEGIFEYNQPMN